MAFNVALPPHSELPPLSVPGNCRGKVDPPHLQPKEGSRVGEVQDLGFGV